MQIRLREVRERKLITQAELSKRTGITEAAISRIETGVSEPRISTIRKLSEGLGVDPDELLEYQRHTTPGPVPRTPKDADS